MGSASSKAARASPPKKPPWAGARMPPYEPKTSPARAQQPWASEFKNEGKNCTLLLSNLSAFSATLPLEIQSDAKDPQLLANLSRLKPVHVHHHKLPTATVSSLFCLSSPSLPPSYISFGLGGVRFFCKGRKSTLGSFSNRVRGRRMRRSERACRITACTPRRSLRFLRSAGTWSAVAPLWRRR